MIWGLLKSFISQITVGIKISLLSILIKIVGGIRMFVLFMALVIMSLMMSAISLFTGIAYAIHKYISSGQVTFDGLLIFCTLAFVIFFLTFSMLMCERLWLKGLKLDEMVKKATDKYY